MHTTIKKIWQPIAGSALWVHHRLLPRDLYFKFMPYLWLPWLAFFFFNYSDHPPDPLRWALYAAGGLVFLALYFRAYRAIHLDSMRELGWIIAAMTLMGCGFMWPYGNGLAFFVYAACLCGSFGSVRHSAYALILVVAAFLISAAAIRLNAPTIISGLFLTVILGIANIYFGEMNRKNRALKL
ncbi:MAG: hypothetical protein ACRESO_03815, partial [Gammaproteobacteria bacterium]